MKRVLVLRTAPTYVDEKAHRELHEELPHHINVDSDTVFANFEELLYEVGIQRQAIIHPLQEWDLADFDPVKYVMKVFMKQFRQK